MTIWQTGGHADPCGVYRGEDHFAQCHDSADAQWLVGYLSVEAGDWQYRAADAIARSTYERTLQYLSGIGRDRRGTGDTP